MTERFRNAFDEIFFPPNTFDGDEIGWNHQRISKHIAAIKEALSIAMISAAQTEKREGE